MVKDKFFKELVIWKTVDDTTIVRYRCFTILPDETFFVQAKEHFYEDSDKKYRESLDDYFYGSLSKELFEQMPKDASNTIEEAISKHEEEFKDMIDVVKKRKKNESK